MQQPESIENVSNHHIRKYHLCIDKQIEREAGGRGMNP